MTALEILSDLRRAGAIVTVAGDKLRFEAPPVVLTDELKQRLATQKAEIIRLLQAETTTSCRGGHPYPDRQGRVKCFYCENCEITGRKAMCQASRKSVSGIALLRECERFVMQTVH